MVFDYLKSIFIPREANIKERIKFIKNTYVGRIIPKENAIENLWEIYARSKNKIVKQLAVDVIKQIDTKMI